MSNARKLADNLPTEGSLTGRNLVINGAMRIDQRNGGSAVSAHNTNLFPVDRFRCLENTGGSVDMQRVQDAPVGFLSSLKFTVTGTDTSLTGTEFCRALHPIEGSNIGHLNWGTSNAKTCTLSFYVKSSVAGQYYVNIFNGSANRTMVKGYTIDAANTWERKIINVVGDTSGSWSAGTGAGIYIGWMQGTGPDYIVSSTDTYVDVFDMVGANQVNLLATNGATWQLTGVQFEVGENNATPFEHEPDQVTLLKCQRYFEVTDQDQEIYGTGSCWTTSAAYGYIPFKVEKRVSPTSLGRWKGAATDYRFRTKGGNYLCTSLIMATSNASTRNARFDVSVGSGLVAGDSGWLSHSGNTTQLYFDSEL